MCDDVKVFDLIGTVVVGRKHYEMQVRPIDTIVREYAHE